MASPSAKRIREGFLQATDDECEPLTFGELPVGARFISVPSPGDNSGHGGLRGTHRIFTKKNMRVISPKRGSGLKYGINHGGAVDGRGVRSDFPVGMPIIRVE